MAQRQIVPVLSHREMHLSIARHDTALQFPKAYDTLDLYANTTHDNGPGGVIDASINTLVTFQDFTQIPSPVESDEATAARKVNTLTDYVALMSLIGQRAGTQHPRRINALRALNHYSKIIEPETWQFVSSMIGDLPVIEKVANDTLVSPGANAKLKPFLAAKVDIPIPADAWKIKSHLPTREIIELINQVNPASVLIAAVNMLRSLKSRSPNKIQALKDAYVADALFAPILEAEEARGISMALRSEASLVRLGYAGEKQHITRAKNTIKDTGNREFVARAIGFIIEDLLGAKSLQQHTIENNSEHDIVVGQSVIHDSENDKTYVALWRRKSVGSLALKYSLGKESMDVIGITIITDNKTQLADVYKRLIEEADSQQKLSGPVAPNKASGKTLPFYVEGSPELIDTVRKMSGMSEARYNKIVQSEPKENKGCFKVAKLTFFYTIMDGDVERKLPVEIQVQTKKMHRKSLLGRASHLSFKTENNAGEPNISPKELRMINAQKGFLLADDVKKITKRRGKDLRAQVRNANASAVGHKATITSSSIDR